MSAPFSTSLISSAWSSTAERPTSGSLPAPSPRVSSRPMSSLMSASLSNSAWASVLTATNSTPRRSASIMRLTAFTPPPPMPTTLMTAMKLCDPSFTTTAAFCLEPMNNSNADATSRHERVPSSGALSESLSQPPPALAPSVSRAAVGGASGLSLADHRAGSSRGQYRIGGCAQVDRGDSCQRDTAEHGSKRDEFFMKI